MEKPAQVKSSDSMPKESKSSKEPKTEYINPNILKWGNKIVFCLVDDKDIVATAKSIDDFVKGTGIGELKTRKSEGELVHDMAANPQDRWIYTGRELGNINGCFRSNEITHEQTVETLTYPFSSYLGDLSTMAKVPRISSSPVWRYFGLEHIFYAHTIDDTSRLSRFMRVSNIMNNFDEWVGAVQKRDNVVIDVEKTKKCFMDDLEKLGKSIPDYWAIFEMIDALYTKREWKPVGRIDIHSKVMDKKDPRTDEMLSRVIEILKDYASGPRLSKNSPELLLNRTRLRLECADLYGHYGWHLIGSFGHPVSLYFDKE
jgi:hypothetical protein